MNIIEKRAISDTAELEAWYEKTSEELPIDADVIVKKDIPYMNGGNARHTFDVYYQPSDHKLPVIFDFHGGGFISGDKKYNKWYASEMAKQGFLVFVIAYPLVFEKNLYGILKDCYEGMKAAYSMIEEFGGNPDAIFLNGDSAGGFLATYLTAINNDPEIAASVDVKPIDMKIKAVGTISALFYCSRIDKNALFVMRSTLLGKEHRKHPFWKYVNPEKEVYKNLPPIYAITSAGDFLGSYTHDFISFLKKNDKTADLYAYENKALEHDFVIMRPGSAESRDAILKISTFLKQI